MTAFFKALACLTLVSHTSDESTTYPAIHTVTVISATSTLPLVFPSAKPLWNRHSVARIAAAMDVLGDFVPRVVGPGAHRWAPEIWNSSSYGTIRRIIVLSTRQVVAY